eukprot:CAMPEP_0119320348 /NCGR_PEP_ID=MMETSP1333-20130426/52156_1 /TAXON_ID=418940 /ORGANISM="Scyphosphaera apsteinii, Strain RCC1455" /LENGTH=204 /DNA_ID=CAMNT_0007327049 /DNA_START=238 /DNA_END=853 /DNA_ORIENTATION=-
MAKQQAISIHVLQAAKLAGFIEKLPPAQPRARWSICSQLVCTLHPLLLQRRNRNAAAAGGDAFIISFGTPSSLPATNLTSDMTSGWTFAVVLCLVRILGFLAAKGGWSLQQQENSASVADGDAADGLCAGVRLQFAARTTARRNDRWVSERPVNGVQNDMGFKAWGFELSCCVVLACTHHNLRRDSASKASRISRMRMRSEVGS